jgi:hypothetical protein
MKFEKLLRSLIREELIRQSEVSPQYSELLASLLDSADSHPEFSGYNLVKGSERDSARLIIADERGVPVGFMTPRFEDGFWRTGAIYTEPRSRGKGYAKKAIIEFFSDPSHRPARVWISDNNQESIMAFTRAGFVQGDRKDWSDSPADKGSYYELR